ncbi:site-specific DNA-methyltransferase [Marinobacter salarius]|uniref:Methyltransferase n=1 Tax=Marinobacter salarius TaxID=1420917 RepID=A0A1W6KFU7_9GAMM|nr:site-specific DNA-methyltransferase [Marinobacter salarius]ARM86280.1 modification methylase PvuII [Marinobacter salarius]
MQLSLFSNVKTVYANSDGPLDNESLYRRVAREAGISLKTVKEKSPIGESGQMHSKFQREVRWHQQTLKTAGLLQHTGQRGRWELTKEGKTSLRKAQPKASMVAFSTDLGTALWSLSADVFNAIDAPVTLCLTSPPYPLAKPRAYGNPSLNDYIEFIVDSMQPIVANLVDGGSICLNVSNDIFCPGTPARSIYREKLVIALAEELGLWKMDELIWSNPNKCPGPVRWASMTRQQLNVGYEPIYWFSNNPKKAIANNRRVLQPHSEKHLDFVRRGGNRMEKSCSDGAYRTPAGGYSRETEGRIPRNILTYPHNCPAQSKYKAAARSMGLAAHGAPYPLKLALFLIQFLSREGDLVVDPFAGSLTTAEGAEITGRKWLVTDCMLEYVLGGSTRFAHRESFRINPDFAALAA